MTIQEKENKIISIEEDERETLLTGNESVSMNIWGFKSSVFEINSSRTTLESLSSSTIIQFIPA